MNEIVTETNKSLWNKPAFELTLKDNLKINAAIFAITGVVAAVIVTAGAIKDRIEQRKLDQKLEDVNVQAQILDNLNS